MAVMAWLWARLRCTQTRKEVDVTANTSRGDSSPSSSSVSSVVNPVVYIDPSGFEWAIRDEVPSRPSHIPDEVMFIPFEVRPQRGYLKNQVLTNCEVPETRSPTAFSGPLISIHTEQLLRKLRARSLELCESTGAHLRSRSGRHLIRRDLAEKERISLRKYSLSTSCSSDRLKPPSQRAAAAASRSNKSRVSSQSSPVDVKTYLAVRARMAAHRK
jgi:hypothetical protein